MFQKPILLLFFVLLCVHEAILLPVVDHEAADVQNNAAAQSKPIRQCEYKCASRNRVCDKATPRGCTEVCKDWRNVCNQEGPCRKECTVTSMKCTPEMNEIKSVVPLCRTICTSWEISCGVTDDLTPIVSKMDDGSGGKNPFSPNKCLPVCAEWDSLFRCTRWNCNGIPQIEGEGADGMKMENMLAEVDCIVACAMWNKFGGCVQSKCFSMQLISDMVQHDSAKGRNFVDDPNLPIKIEARNWWDEIKKAWNDYVAPAATVCSAIGCWAWFG